jgi:mono/diheme cytochrome c family protein
MQFGVVAGLDPAIHLLAKRMDPRVKPAGDRQCESKRSKSALAASMVQVRGLPIAVLVYALMCAPSMAQDSFAPAQISLGAEIFARNCSPCHGPRMQEPEGAFDLRTFPPDQHTRFVNSVSQGKNQMPPWAGLLQPEEIEALWAYVVAGEKRD